MSAYEIIRHNQSLLTLDGERHAFWTSYLVVRVEDSLVLSSHESEADARECVRLLEAREILPQGLLVDRLLREVQSSISGSNLEIHINPEGFTVSDDSRSRLKRSLQKERRFA